MKRPLAVFLPLLLSLITLVAITGCSPPSSDPNIDCTEQALIDAIDAANSNPDATIIDLSPGCTYLINQAHAADHTGLPTITTDITIRGHGAEITRPERSEQYGIYRLFFVDPDGRLSLENLTLRGGRLQMANMGGASTLSQSGAAVYNKGDLILHDTVIEDNRGTEGSGIYVTHYLATLTIENSEFLNNTASLGGAAIKFGVAESATITGTLFDSNSAKFCSAISNYSVMTISETTISNNHSQLGGTLCNTHQVANLSLRNSVVIGNDIDYGYSVLDNENGAVADLENVTISGNVSNSTRNAIRNNGILNVGFSTITENVGNAPAIVSETAGLTIANSIITNNVGGNCDPGASITTSGVNIDSDGSCSGFITTDPLLGPLVDNGGATLTHALDPNSPAINMASGSCPASDQRGASRPYGSACDLGAYESEIGTSVCDVQFVIDAINDANLNPNPTTIELTPGCIYVVNEAYPVGGSSFQDSTGLPLITTEVSIIGNGAIITRPEMSEVQQRFRLLGVTVSGNLSLSNLALTNGYLSGFFGVPNHDSESGGAILNEGILSLSDILFEENKGRNGGAICNLATALMTINSSEFNNNHGFNSGGVIYNLGEVVATDSKYESNSTGGINLAASHGGAIYNMGEMEIISSSFKQNEADVQGGGIYNRLVSSNLTITGSFFYLNESGGSSALYNEEGHISILNTTISKNTSDYNLNAIHNEGGSLEISFSTISQNWGDGATVSSDNTNVTINNSIIAMNHGPSECSFPGPINATGNNLTWGPSCPDFSLQADPLLGGPGYNDGSTMNYSLAQDSPAIDMARGDCPAIDQRGVTRPQSFFCDLGAYESEDVETCSIHYLVSAINFANSDPDHTVIDLEPGCNYLVDQQYGDRQTGLPQLTTPITIHGNGATITRPGLEQQPDEYRFFYVDLGTTVSISNLTLSSGVITGSEGINDDSDSHGGAIFNRGVLSLTGITFQANQALFGGALANNSRGGLTLSDSVFQENQAAHDGGALYLGGRGGAEISGVLFEDNLAQGENSGGQGGAIYNQYDLTLTGSTLSANDSRQGGGGLYNIGEADLVSCTLGWNSASQAGGSALQNQSGTLSVLNSTLSGNQTGPGDLYTVYNGGGLIRISYSTITAAEGGAAALGGSGNLDSYRYEIINSIVAMNPPGDCAPGIAITVYGNNLDSDGSCLGFSHTGDPLLQSLADNGGGTWTHAIPMASSALNAASVECPISDQRGVSRPQGSACDLGAFEYDGIQPTPSPTPEVDACIFDALRNTNCRLSDCARAGLVASLPMGDTARLIGLNPQGSHGLFELPGGVECWMLMNLLTGGDQKVCNPNIELPPPCPTPEGIICSADLGEAECVEAGGIYHPPIASAAWCECP